MTDFSLIDIPAVLFGLGNAAFALILLRWHAGDGPFDFRYTLMERGRISLSRLGQLTALVVSTGVIVHETVKGRLSEWLLLAYMGAWAGTYIAKKFAPSKAPEDVPPAA